MDNISKIKIVHEWVQLNGNTPIPQEIFQDDHESPQWFNHGEQTPSMLSKTIPPELLKVTKEDIEDEINKLDKSVDTSHTEDCENMQELSEQFKPSIK